MSKTTTTCRNYPHVTRLLEAKIYTRRKERDISQTILAKRTGLTRNCIQQIECYEHLPHMTTLFDLIKALEFTDEESKAFMVELMNAYQANRELQEEQGIRAKAAF